ncbi:MAG TPA: hypothetical protein VJN50_02605 [Actinomycetota bacterium]|nr:hypothetical protein [Actinomycetota bacterium]
MLAAARDIQHLVPAAHRDLVFRKGNGWIAAAVVQARPSCGTWSLDGHEVSLDLWERIPKPALAREVWRLEELATTTDEELLTGDCLVTYPSPSWR